MENSSVDYTLEDGAWKDSFDKLLDVRPVLRELNILKKDVHASYNLNSSVENSVQDSSSLLMPPTIITRKPRKKAAKRPNSVSTPVVNRLSSNPFKCSLSPIGNWNLRSFSAHKQMIENQNEVFHATPINPNIIVCDYEAAEVEKSKRQVELMDFSPLPIRTGNLKSKNIKEPGQQNQVCFEMAVQITPQQKKSHPERIITIPNEERPKSITHKSHPEKIITVPNPERLKRITHKSHPEKIITVPNQERPKRITHKSHPEKIITERPGLQKQVCFEMAVQTTPQQKKSHPEKIITIPNPERPKSITLNPHPEKIITVPNQEHPKRITLHPGKWRKSLAIWRRTNVNAVGENVSCTQHEISNGNDTDSVVFVAVVPLLGCRKSQFLKTERRSSARTIAIYENEWERQVMQRCSQQSVHAFEELYAADHMENCRKIGEGAYGEVFLKSTLDDETRQTVIKIIPIEGSLKINGEVQKTYEQMLPEIVISSELCKLAANAHNSTPGFVDIKNIACVRGKYPDHLIKLWEEYDESKESENDHPRVFSNDQLYIVLELGFAGADLAVFAFDSAEQAYYALEQIILTLAVGEEAFQFEHRDLHWGNILIHCTTDKHLTYILNDIELTVPTKGIKTTIIDYTLSRMTVDNCCLYNDLANDEELFSATGDYQFDIYRMMRDALNNDWAVYEPKTNIFWISYIIDKMINGVTYKIKRQKNHVVHMRKLRALKKIVLDFKSTADCAKHLKKLS